MNESRFCSRFLILWLIIILSAPSLCAGEILIKRSEDRRDDLVGTNIRTRLYIPLTASFESGELALFFESSVGMCNVSVEDENGNVQMSEIIDTDNGTEFWFDLTGLSTGLHYVKISYGSINLVGEFYVE